MTLRSLFEAVWEDATEYIGCILTLTNIIFALINCNINWNQRKDDASKYLKFLSITTSLLAVLGSLVHTLSRFVPYIEGRCICREMYIAAQICYVTALYCVKRTYLEIAQISNLNSISIWLKVPDIYIYCSIIPVIYFTAQHSHGECIAQSHRCHQYADPIIMFTAWTLLLVDAFFYQFFCKALVGGLCHQKEDTVPKCSCLWIPGLWSLAAIPWISCSLDLLVNLFYAEDPSNIQLVSIAFLTDITILSLCNLFLSKLQENGIKSNAANPEVHAVIHQRRIEMNYLMSTPRNDSLNNPGNDSLSNPRNDSSFSLSEESTPPSYIPRHHGQSRQILNTSPELEMNTVMTELEINT